MPMWFDETFGGRVRLGMAATQYVYKGKSEYQTVDIFDTVPFGRALALDGVYQTSVGDEYNYHEMLVHPALTTAPCIKRVLVIGGGDGGTVREVLRYPEVEQVTMVELDELVTQACKEHLTEMNIPWDDPRLSLRFEDGVAYLKNVQEKYDVILIDGPDPVGPAEGLYESPFYTACRDALTPEGVFAAQTEGPQLMEEDFTRIHKTLRRVFPTAAPYFGPVPVYVCGSWSYCYATKLDKRPEPVAARVDAIEPGCRYWNRDIQVSAFVQSNFIKKCLAD